MAHWHEPKICSPFSESVCSFAFFPGGAFLPSPIFGFISVVTWVVEAAVDGDVDDSVVWQTLTIRYHNCVLRLVFVACLERKLQFSITSNLFIKYEIINSWY